MSIGEVIRLSRQKPLYAQEDFAQELNVALSTINRYELNKTKPNIQAVKAIKTICDKNNLNYEKIENE